MAGHCHVRKLNIRTGDRACMPRVTFILEDALRTASFPGMPANGIVFMRSLDLGKHNLSASSRVVARKIDELFRHARPVMITENAPEQPLSQIVWFPDELTPYRFMVKMLSENHRPVSWYWPSAVRGWNSWLSVKQSYHLIMSNASAQETGIGGMHFVLEPLFNNRAIHDVLNALEPKEASRLLMNMGLRPSFDFTNNMEDDSKGRDSYDGNDFNEPSEKHLLRETINRATGMWPPFDPRIMLLSYLVLKRTGEKASPDKVNRMLTILSNSQNRVEETQRTASPAGVKTATGPVDIASFMKKDGNDNDGHHDMDNGIIVSTSEVPSPEFKAPVLMEDTGPLDDGLKDMIAGAWSLLNQKDADSGINQTVAVDQSHDTSLKQLPSFEKSGQVKQKGGSRMSFKKHALTEYRPGFSWLAGELSENAGLVFLVPLLKRLGIESLIETYPLYEDLNLAERIICRCAELLQIPHDDPAVSFLDKKFKTSYEPVEFTAPSQWRMLVSGSSENARYRISRIKGMPGHRLIMDEKGRIVLGVWNRKNRALIRPWIEPALRPFEYADPQSWSLDHLVNNFIIAMNRYVHRYALMELFCLIKRQGYIATTRTHLDVTIPLNQLDIRIRMAGLDIDPGWAPWLGRVVQFHYAGGEG